MPACHVKAIAPWQKEKNSDNSKSLKSFIFNLSKTSNNIPWVRNFYSSVNPTN
jgi:hypothetical protein